MNKFDMHYIPTFQGNHSLLDDRFSPFLDNRGGGGGISGFLGEDVFNSTYYAAGGEALSKYSTALSVTIAIGCTLLVLNVLIFAAVYYQR